MEARDLRRLIAPLTHTPLHPQWLLSRCRIQTINRQLAQLSGRVLDIGCAEGEIQHQLPSSAEYLGLDHYRTATNWYGTQPDVFGDGQALPFHDDSIDHVLLLDVLEHIPDADACLAEIRRVLRPTGLLFLKVPFLYPLHDEPLDFHRWTYHGLERLAAMNGFQPRIRAACGSPPETSALLGNLALSRIALKWIRDRNPLVVLLPVFAIGVLFSNCLGWLLSFIAADDDYMPLAYYQVWERQRSL